MPLLWVAATVVATALAWAAVSLVAAGVTERPPPVLPQARVAAALGDAFTVSRQAPPAPHQSGPAVSSGAARPSGPVPPSGPAVGSALPGAGQTSSPYRGAEPVSGASSRTDGSEGSPQANAGSPTSTAPPSTSRTFSTAGGSVTVSCQGSAISLVAATPQDGYAVTVSNAGPEEVEVHFTSDRNESEVKATCVGGQPTLAGSDGG